MTVTEFLLARYDEDERAANHAGSHPESWGVMANDNYGHLLVQPHHVLVDLEAKRRIVEMMSDEIEYVVYGDDVLRALASVYADHPDYRPEWKP